MSTPRSPGRRFPWPPVLFVLAIALVGAIALIVIERADVKPPPNQAIPIAVTVSQPRSFVGVDTCAVLTTTEIDSLFGRGGLAVPAAYSTRTERYEGCTVNGEKGTGSIVFSELDDPFLPFPGYFPKGRIELIGGNTAFLDDAPSSGRDCVVDVVLTNATSHTMLSIGTTGLPDVGPITCDQVRTAAATIIARLPPTAP